MEVRHVYSVKWGDKYDYSHVNKLYESCKKHMTYDFQFHCLTDNPMNLDKDINIILIPDNNVLEKWWTKMFLFDESVVTQTGEKLFFDLDVILQKNVDVFWDYDPEDCLAIVKTWWHDLETQWKETRHIPHKYTDLNSSVLRWNDNLDCKSLYRYFLKHKQQILWYYRGLDNFFFNKEVVNLKMFPIGWVYSFNHGYIYPHDVERHVYRELPYICSFDSMGNEEDVKF